VYGTTGCSLYLQWRNSAPDISVETVQKLLLVHSTATITIFGGIEPFLQDCKHAPTIYAKRVSGTKTLQLAITDKTQDEATSAGIGFDSLEQMSITLLPSLDHSNLGLLKKY
jgi:hypothetical protein